MSLIRKIWCLVNYINISSNDLLSVYGDFILAFLHIILTSCILAILLAELQTQVQAIKATSNCKLLSDSNSYGIGYWLNIQHTRTTTKKPK